MKITKTQLKQIIKEELEAVLGEEMSPAELEAAKHEECRGAIDYEKCMGHPAGPPRSSHRGGAPQGGDHPSRSDPRFDWYEE
jgi:hypothetical protein